jgi:hypothetical protein
MAYNRGQSNNIIVGAAALFTYEPGELTDSLLPAYQPEGTVIIQQGLTERHLQMQLA